MQKIRRRKMTVDLDEGKKAEEQPGFAARLRAVLNLLPAYTWYAAPRGALTFVNTRTAEYLGIPNDHPLRFGIDVGAEWDHSFALLHPDDREDARKYWSSRLRTGEGGEHSYRVRSAQEITTLSSLAWNRSDQAMGRYCCGLGRPSILKSSCAPRGGCVKAKEVHVQHLTG
jgi:PAS domain-containing protein